MVYTIICVCVRACVRACVCVCVCGGGGGGHVYVVYEDTNLYNDMGMKAREILQGEGDL